MTTNPMLCSSLSPSLPLHPQEDVERGHWALPTESDVVNSYGGSSGVRLRPEDVIVCETKINYGMRGANPLDSVHFFDHWDSAEKHGMRHSQITSMMAAAFQVRPGCCGCGAMLRRCAAVPCCAVLQRCCLVGLVLRLGSNAALPFGAKGVLVGVPSLPSPSLRSALPGPARRRTACACTRGWAQRRT